MGRQKGDAKLTSSICLTRVSEALSEMFPTNTVVATFITEGDIVGTWCGRQRKGVHGRSVREGKGGGGGGVEGERGTHSGRG